MRFFFKSRRFKIMASIASVIIVVSIIFVTVGGIASPLSSLAGAVIAPAEKFFNGISDSVGDFFEKLNDADKIMLENAELKEKINELNSDIIDYEKIKDENEFYKNYLNIKDENPDFELLKASLISKNEDDIYGSFLIDKGSLSGVALYDPVITSAGLVGYVGEISPSYSKVITILDPKLSCGAFDRRTKDVGIVSGAAENAKAQKTRIKNISRTSSVAIGDMIVTSGGGVFPENLLIGTLEGLHREDYSSSVYGTVTPAVDFDDISDVMIITYFNGQGNLLTSGD